MLPLIERIGVLATNSAGAAVAWAGCGLLWVTIRYGGRMRAFVDVGFSTPADN
ncbi:hypothetical protein OF83DRAFT_1180912 [Amylostereum chailletii]|nr:hypothetical protein OF83DRAFT_1180912 [Amylostereum chailletii]